MRQKQHRGLFGDGAYCLSRREYIKAIAPWLLLLLVLVGLTLLGIYSPERGQGSTAFVPASDIEMKSRAYLDDLRAGQREVLEEGSTHRMP